LGAVYGCSAARGKPFSPNLVGQQRYLCCSMTFSKNNEASDSNYAQYLSGIHKYEAGSMLPAGTKVTVTKVGQWGVQFRPDDSQEIYTLGFSYGWKHLDRSKYFENVLRETDPVAAVTPSSPAIATAIKEGRLVSGMTRNEALLARGYPPAHKTPDLEADEWIYYETPGFMVRVVFLDGKITSMTREEAD